MSPLELIIIGLVYKISKVFPRLGYSHHRFSDIWFSGKISPPAGILDYD
jgi:hypothetical protein